MHTASLISAESYELQGLRSPIKYESQVRLPRNEIQISSPYFIVFERELKI